MSNNPTAIEHLSEQIGGAYRKLEISKLSARLLDFEQEVQQPDFWNDPSRAQAKMKEIAQLSNRVKPWEALNKNLEDIKELLVLNDPSLASEIEDQIAELSTQYDQLKSQLLFSGEYDDHSVILSIHAGAGGTDAQDWTQMLMRMYTRFAEQQDASIELLERAVGDEAGIKSATLQIDMPFAYGKLRGEHGVHRLVRLSPFNSDNLRQTSFAKVDVMPKIDQPSELPLDESQLKIDVYRSGGHGGQSVNTTDSAVRVTHIPSGITVSIQNERSQIQNKETALTILRSRLARLRLDQHKERIDDIKGPSQSAEWGNQIRSYVLHPYKQVKDLRTRYETSDVQTVLDGDLQGLIDAYLDFNMGSQP